MNHTQNTSVDRRREFVTNFSKPNLESLKLPDWQRGHANDKERNEKFIGLWL